LCDTRLKATKKMSRQYLSAGKIVDAVETGRKSFKAHCANQAQGAVGKVDFALAGETLKYSKLLDAVFRRVGVTKKTLDVGSTGMLKVLAYELLLGKGKIDGGGAVKRKLMEIHDSLRRALADEMQAHGAQKPAELLPAGVAEASRMNKFVRMNELKVVDADVCLTAVRQEIPAAALDDLIPMLIVMPPERSLGGFHALVKGGQLIIQDKASCFPSQCLYDEWLRAGARGDVVDCCAAPGNKTSHVAALTAKHRGQGKDARPPRIYAFDKDAKRAALLQRRMQEAGADGSVVVRNEDFLALDVRKYATVTAVLLDPSCSGSGVARALERVIAVPDAAEVDKEAERVDKLRAFQVEALTKAMSFPAAATVVYSTCSVNVEENESVVAEVLAAAAAHGGEWEVVEPERFRQWPRRGVPCPGLTAAQQRCLLRCLPCDGMNGFFVAVFRKQIATATDEPPVEGMRGKRRGVVDVAIDHDSGGKRPRRQGRWTPLHLRNSISW